MVGQSQAQIQNEGRPLVGLVSVKGAYFDWSAQEGRGAARSHRTEYHPHVSIVPGRVMNSAYRKGTYYNDHPETVWRPGDFVVHVTGETNQTLPMPSPLLSRMAWAGGGGGQLCF